MSNIYIQEPPTNGKVLIVTTVGDIDIELWTKEAPKACRNFIQLCMEGYYNGVIFHRVIRDFIVQGGDPTGTGEGGESIWGRPFKDEVHSRLRFTRRGLVAMANAGSNDNGSQFFFTLGTAPELNNKHTIFGKVAGNTVYNMIKLGDCDIGENDRPVYPHKILRTKILASPFNDIVPRTLATKKDRSDESQKKKSTAKATKNFNLLSFGEEAEEDEEEVDKATQSMRGKSKSSHDLLDDEKLSAEPAIHQKRKHSDSDESSEDEPLNPVKPEDLDSIKKKLKGPEKEKEKDKKDKETKTEAAPSAKDKDTPTKDKQPSRVEELRREQENLKRDIVKQKHNKDKPIEKVKSGETEEDTNPEETLEDSNDLIGAHKAEYRKFKEQKKLQKTKGSGREAQTLAILEQFKSKLSSAQQLQDEVEPDDTADTSEQQQDDEADASDDITWLGHKLQFDDKTNKVMDANIDDADRYEIYDPRNPLTKRRRESSKQKKK